MKTISLLLSAALILLMALTPHQTALSLGLTQTCGLMDWHRLTYMTMHANWVHLAVNLYAFLSLVFLGKSGIAEFLAAIILSMMIPSGLIGATPMIGMSVVNFALTGITVMRSERRIFLMLTNLALMLPALAFANIATGAHLFGLLSGAALSFLYYWVFSPRYED